ncbi:amidohydrolase family protein [Brevundimonas sp. NIBR10]|uniref:amidohydrolase family protein n=1 Tax=Brevundimonas sp. NIBR10 TaxID=3015997 RepID=UPI0022F1B5F6|nr:amidohydrolase family protein [Brevundimonas sp. NIBR10]
MSRPRVARTRKGGLAVIDVHCHVLDPQAERLAEGLPERPVAGPTPGTAAGWTADYNRRLIETAYRPRLTDLSARLADMDAMGVDLQILSPSPTQYYYWAGPEAAEALVLRQNEGIAELCARHPDRLAGLATVSLQHPERAAAQARHAIRELGLKGVEISTLVGADPVDAPRFDPFWSAMNDLGAPVLLHPLGTTLGSRLDDHYLSNIIGQPAETAVALSRLIMGGHLDRFDAVRICAVHGGGYLPLYAGRSDHAWSVRPESCGCLQPPSAYLKRLWFDSLVYDPAHLRRLIDVVGADRVVVGTDYPFDMGDYDPVGLIRSVEGLSPAERDAILSGNAIRLFGLEA